MHDTSSHSRKPFKDLSKTHCPSCEIMKVSQHRAPAARDVSDVRILLHTAAYTCTLLHTACCSCSSSWVDVGSWGHAAASPPYRRRTAAVSSPYRHRIVAASPLLHIAAYCLLFLLFFVGRCWFLGSCCPSELAVLRGTLFQLITAH